MSSPTSSVYGGAEGKLHQYLVSPAFLPFVAGGETGWLTFMAHLSALANEYNLALAAGPVIDGQFTRSPAPPPLNGHRLQSDASVDTRCGRGCVVQGHNGD